MLAELNIIGIAIAIVVAIVASLLKKKEPAQEWELPSELNPKRDQPPPSKAGRWEEELRRVLEQQRPTESRPVPPPIVRQIPPPVPPVVYYEPVVDEGESTHQEPVMTPHFGGLTEAAERHAHAASLWERTQEQLHQQHGPTHRAAPPAFVRQTQATPEVRELLEMLRRPQGARTAILASVVLGPPRAFET